MESDPEIENSSEGVEVKKKRQISPEARKTMLANLEKAREARAANRANITKYPKEKRDRAKQMYQEDVERKAEEKARLIAEEILSKKEQERELEEYRQWKKKSQSSQSLEEEPEVVAPKPKAKPKPKPKPKQPSAKSAAAPSKSTKSKPKKEKEREPSEERDEYLMQPPTYPLSYLTRGGYGSYGGGGFNIDDFLG